MATQREKRRKVGESKEDRFRRLMAKRATKAKEDFRLIGNLANRAHYSWKDAEVRKVFEDLEAAFLAAKVQFLPDDHYWTQLLDKEDDEARSRRN